MKELSYYTTHKFLTPLQSDYTTYYVYDNGEVIFTGNEEEFKEFKKDSVTYSKAVVQKVVDKEKYKEHVALYRQESSDLEQEFKNDLFEYFKVQNNPKRELCYSIAYDKGHSCGFGEVFNEFEILVELIQ